MKFIKVTEDKFDEMLGCVPPIEWERNRFLVGEPNDHRRCRVTGRFLETYHGYWRFDGQCYGAAEDTTIPEFRAIGRSEVTDPANEQVIGFGERDT
jgi:hypothetical protein